MTHIDIDSLFESELRDLNRRIVERLRMIRDVKAHVTMIDFRLGEQVVFYTTEGEPIFGRVDVWL